MPKTAMQAAPPGVLLPLAACTARAKAASPSVLVLPIYNDRYPPEYAADGDPGTRWAGGADGDAPRWLLIASPTPTDLADLTIAREQAAAAESEPQGPGGGVARGITRGCARWGEALGRRIGPGGRGWREGAGARLSPAPVHRPAPAAERSPIIAGMSVRPRGRAVCLPCSRRVQWLAAM